MAGVGGSSLDGASPHAGMWSGVTPGIANTGLGSGHGLGNVSTAQDMSGFAGPSGAWSTGMPSTFQRGQMATEEEANSSIHASGYFDNERDKTFGVMPYPRVNEIAFERCLDKPSTRTATRDNLPGPHSSVGQCIGLTQLNRLLRSSVGRKIYNGRSAEVVLNDWVYAGIGVLDPKTTKPGTQTIIFAKKANTHNIWAVDGQLLRERSVLTLVLTKRSDRKNTDGSPSRTLSPLPLNLKLLEQAMGIESTTTADESEDVPGSDEKHIGDPEIEMKMLAASWFALLSADADRHSTPDDEYWVFIPVACPPGCLPDLKLYCNSSVRGDYIKIGTMYYYVSGSPNAHRINQEHARKAIFLEAGADDESTQALLDLPTIYIMAR